MGICRRASSVAVGALIFAVLVASLFASCGTDEGTGGAAPARPTETAPSTSPTPAPSPVPTPDEDPGGGRSDIGSNAPPPVVVTGAGDPIELQAWTFCYSNMCADGFPPEDPPAVGDTESVRFEFPLDEWTFEASFETVGQECPRTITVPVTEDGDGTWTLGAAGHPGTYDVTLFGRGNGDLFVTFRWTTTTEGTLPEPSARVAVLADNNGRLETYGVELTLSDMAATPEVAEATITVRSSEGNEHSFTPNPVGACWAEGTIAWNGPIEDGEVSSRLGTAPFTYEVVVVLDGTMHRSVAMWPSDQIVGNEPSVELVFDPPLPHMT